MKKLIALFIVLGLVTTAVFAEVTVGGWGRARWAPMVFNGGAGNANDKGEFSGALGAGSGPGWTGDGEAGLRFQIGGKNEANTVGFFFEARYDYSDAKYFASDNQAYAWVKPFNFLTITGGGGNLGGDTFRGKFGRNDGWNAGINSWLTAEDDIFWRFAARGTFAVHFKFEFEQLQGLSVQAAFPSSGADGASGTGVDGNNTSKIAHVFGGSQVAVGYTIPNIGLARFQFIGGRYAGKIDKSSYVLLQDSDVAPGAWAAGQTAGNISSSPKPGYGYDVSYLDGSKDYAQIQFAFNLLAVEGLGADLGFTYPLPLTVDELHAGTIPITGVNTPAAGITLAKDDVYQAPIGIHLGGKYTLSSGDFAVNYRISTRFAEKEKYAAAGSFDKKYGAQFFLGLQPTYKLGEIGTVGLDFSLTTKGSDSQDVTDFRNGANSIGVGLFFSRPIANGAFTIGFLSKFAAGGDAYKVFTAGPGSSPARTQLQVDNAKKKATSISIPIMWEYSL